MTTNDEPIQTNEDILEGWVLVETSTTSPGPLGQLAIEVPEHQEEESDDDSAFGSCPSSTASLTSSICACSTIHGRQYHSDRWNSQYCFPIDQRHIEVQKANHFANRELLEGKLHVADLESVKKPIQKVLDVGSGKGYWAINFADEHPDIEVTGTDLSSIGEEWVPPNLQFEIDDCSQHWNFDNSCFGFIHMRNLTGGIEDWPHVFGEAFRCTSPGGLVESHEESFILKSDNESIEPRGALEEMGNIFKEAGHKTGCSFTIVDEGAQRKLMEEAGFVDVEEVVMRMPISKMHKDPDLQKVGRIAYEALLHDLEGRLLYVTTQVLEWSKDDTYFFAMKVRKQLKQMDVYVDHRIVVGRKSWSGSD